MKVRSKNNEEDKKMSAIDPVRRTVLLQQVGMAADLNEPAPISGKPGVETVEPVKSASRAALDGERRELTFDVDTESDRLVLQVIDENTGRIVYQDPNDRLVKLARERRHNFRRVP